MTTISGGSKPTFTADQVLHAVEMNQLNQEWIVDSVPEGSTRRIRCLAKVWYNKRNFKKE
jgi:cytochrome c556